MKTKLLLSIFISIIMISCNKEENSTFNIVQESRAIEQQENPFNDSLILMPYNSVIDSLFQLDEYNEYYKVYCVTY